MLFFLFYPGGLNRALCCKKGVCTECFLQIKRPTSSVSCPFCNRLDFQAIFTGPLSSEERERESNEQQKVIELKIKMRQEEIERDGQRERDRSKANSFSSSSPSVTPGSSPLPVATPSFLSADSPQDNPLSSQRKENKTPVGSPIPPSPLLSHPVTNMNQELDLDELMLMEAIRLSLIPGQNEPEKKESEEFVNTPPSPSPRSRFVNRHPQRFSAEMSAEESTEVSHDEEMELALAIQLSLQNQIETN